MAKGHPADNTTISMGGTVIAEVMSINGNITRDVVDVSHLESLAREFAASITDNGEVTIEGNFLPDDAAQTALTDDLATQSATLNAAGGKAEFVITWPTQTVASTTTWTFDGVVTSFDPGGSLGDKLAFTATIKVDGVILIEVVPPPP